MRGVYVDTSALGRVLLGEPGAAAIGALLAEFDQHVASRLARIELRRLALRHDLLAGCDLLLSAVALVPMRDELLELAESIQPASVASREAIHLATAVELAADGAVEAILTFDARLADGARARGLTTLALAK